MTQIVKVNENTGYFESDKGAFLGLWYKYIKDADVLSAPKMPLIKLLQEVKLKNGEINQPHFDAIEFSAIGIQHNEFDDTKSEGGYIIFFEWSRLVARKFSSTFPKNALLCVCLYSGIGTEAMFLHQEVFKPKGISSNKFVSYFKAICPKCYNILDNERLDRFILNELADLSGMKVVAKSESCCPNCKSEMSVTGILNLNSKEAAAIKKRGWVSKDYISDLQDPKQDYKTYKDKNDAVLGKDKIMKFYEEDLRNNPELDMEGITLNDKKSEPSPSKGCLSVLVFIVLIALSSFIITQNL